MSIRFLTLSKFGFPSFAVVAAKPCAHSYPKTVSARIIPATIAKPFLRTIITGCVFGLSLSALPAKADDWGCQVLLCLSNPGGPTQYAECVPPISKLYEHLAKGGGFPTCTAGSGTAGNKAVASNQRWGVQQYEDCPAGYAYEVINRGICYRDVSLSSLGGVRYQLKTEESYVINGVPVSENVDPADLGLPGVMVRQRVMAARRAQPNYLDYTLNGETKRVWW